MPHNQHKQSDRPTGRPLLQALRGLNLWHSGTSANQAEIYCSATFLQILSGRVDCVIGFLQLIKSG